MRHRNPTPLTGPFSLASQKIKFQTFLWTAILLLIVPSIAWAAQVTLAWNPNQTRPDGYRLYQRTQGQSYNFSRPVWSGTGTTATITNLNEGTQYFFVVRAFVGSRQSGNSNEAAFIAASANRAPTANAGADQTVAPVSRVTLNGTASRDPDGGTLTYTWAQTAGPGVQLSSTGAAQPTFTAPTGTTSPIVLTFRLTVRDPQGLSSSDTCQVTVSAVQPANQPPTANAGSDQTVSPSSRVTLNGSASKDPDGGALTYTWAQTAGPGVTISNTRAAQPTFTAPAGTTAPMVLTFRLTVRDPQGLSSSDTCQVTVSAVKPPALAPVANAGTDQTVAPLSNVTLNGSASKDPAGSALTYTWTQTAGPSVQLSNTRAVRPTFTAPAASAAPIVLTFRLTVRNPQSLTASDTCQVVINAVKPPAQAPVAQAGANQTVTSAASVLLNGSESFHPDKKTLSYQWVQTGGPKVSLSSAKTARPRFTAPTAPTGGRVTLVFELTVTDPNRLTSSDTCLVQVVPTPSGNPPAESPAPPANEPPKPDDKAPVPAQPELPPKQPMVYFPVDGATNIALTPRLTASAFSGGDVDDTHLRSQWRVWKTQNKQTVLNVTRKRNPLNTLWIPFFTLSPGTTYACQVRYFDHQGQASKWSSPVHFTTRNSWFTRSDSNLTDETSIPVAVDLNVEGITGVEMLQAVQTADGSYLVAVEIENNETVESIDVVAAVSPDSTEPQPPFESTHPDGLLGYRLQLVEPGQEASVILHFSDPIEPRTTWIAYGADGEWVDCTHNVQVQADGMTVVRTIVDGGEEDADGVANGTIVDLLAPLQIAADLPPPEQSGGSAEQSSASGSGGGGCFIGALFQ